MSKPHDLQGICDVIQKVVGSCAFWRYPRCKFTPVIYEDEILFVGSSQGGDGMLGWKYALFEGYATRAMIAVKKEFGVDIHITNEQCSPAFYMGTRMKHTNNVDDIQDELKKLGLSAVLI